LLSQVAKRRKKPQKNAHFLTNSRDFGAKNVDFHPLQRLIAPEPPAASGASRPTKRGRRFGFAFAGRAELNCYNNILQE
jgi:hypothetical protein